MKAFFSPNRYRNGDLAAVLALVYLLMVGWLLVSAAQEGAEAEGGFAWGLSWMATLPLSGGVMQGDQDWGPWMLPIFTVCALVNAFVIWVVFRGRRIRSD